MSGGGGGCAGSSPREAGPELRAAPGTRPQLASWPPEVVLEAALAAGDKGLGKALLMNHVTGRNETLLDLVAFGAPEVSDTV